MNFFIYFFGTLLFCLVFIAIDRFFESEKSLIKRLNRLECRRSGLKARKIAMETMFKTTGSMWTSEYKELLNITQEIAALDTQIGQVKFELDDKIMKQMGVKAPVKGDKNVF